MTGMKKMARKTVRPFIFPLSSTATKRLNKTVMGMEVNMDTNVSKAVRRKVGYTARART